MDYMARICKECKIYTTSKERIEIIAWVERRMYSQIYFY
jgi:hypothetical protein